MLSKILRENGTEISGIKSVTYTETVNAGDGLMPGCVASASIDVEVYGEQSEAPYSGEALTYYQVDNDGNETLMGTFYAEPSIPTRATYKFLAYDAVAKLDKIFSDRLKALQFPVTVYALVSEACSVAGVTLGSSSWPLSTQTVKTFYADNLTCRHILQYAAEIAGRFVRCDANGNIVFDWYTTNTTYSIEPGVGTNIVAYKQDGLTYDNFVVLNVDAVAVRPAESEGAAYIYPSSYPTITASDPNGDGNVVLYNINVTDDGNGNLYLSVEAEDTNNNGNVEIGNTYAASNTLIISDNLLLMGADASFYNAVAQNLYSVISSLPTYRHAEIQLFPNENPFRAGQFVSVTDAQGVSFLTPVFDMIVSAGTAVLRSSGKRTYEAGGTSKELANLSAQLVQFKGEVVFIDALTDGTTTISGDNIRTGTINAERIDTQNLHVNAANIDGTLTVGQLPSDVATESEVTTITNDTISTTNVVAQNLQIKAANIDGTLSASQIRLGGEMTVYRSLDSAPSGGSIGYMTGLSVDNNGTQTTTSGMALKSSDGSHYLVVTTGGVRMTEVSGNSTYDAYLASGYFRTNATLSAQAAVFNGSINAKSSMTLAGGLYNAAGNSKLPVVLYTNSSPSSAQVAGYLSTTANISGFGLFYVEVCWNTSYTSHRAGTWVYVPSTTAVIAHPSIDWYSGSYDAHAYRLVTFRKGNSNGSQIEISSGTTATGSGTTESTSSAVVTTILGMAF